MEARFQIFLILLAVLVMASLGMFAWRLRPIALNVLRAKKDVGFKLAPLGRRVWYTPK